jgi:hypothetical protein
MAEVAVIARRNSQPKLGERPLIVLGTFIFAAIGATISLLTYLDQRRSEATSAELRLHAEPTFSWRFQYDKGFFVRLKLVNVGQRRVALTGSSLWMVVPRSNLVPRKQQKLLATATGFNRVSCVVAGARRTPHPSRLNRPFPLNIPSGEGATVAIAFDYAETPQPQDVDEEDLDWPLVTALGFESRRTAPTLVLKLTAVPGGQRSYVVEPLPRDVKMAHAITTNTEVNADLFKDWAAGDGFNPPERGHGCAY